MCKLPIELWYIDHEINDACIFEMQELGVSCKNLADYDKAYAGTRGYMLKPFSILHSAFEEVLFIDADNICLGDPEKLFYTNEYLETGAVFWPDYWKTASDNPIWDIMGVPFSESPEQESGQILIDKMKCWKALNLCTYLNQNHKIYHKLLLGDKDTFRFSWMALGQRFYQVEKYPDTCGYMDDAKQFMGFTMIQYSIDSSKPLFLHRNLIKWSESADDVCLWQKIKRLITVKDLDIFIGYSTANKHTYMDFSKACEILDFSEIFGAIEVELLKYLRELRAMKFYKDFLASNGALILADGC